MEMTPSVPQENPPKANKKNYTVLEAEFFTRKME